MRLARERCQFLAGADTADSSLAFLLGPEHRAVGVPEQYAGTGEHVLRDDVDSQSQADGGTDMQFAPVEHESVFQAVQDSVRDRTRGVLIDVGEEDSELVTTQAHESAAVSDAADQAPGELCKHSVTGAVAIGVVDGFEIVKVDEQGSRRRATRRSRCCQGSALRASSGWATL